MDVTPVIPAGKKILTAYGEGSFHINGQPLRPGSILLLPDTVIEWEVTALSMLTPSSFAPLEAFASEIELLLLGSGPTHTLLPSSLQRALSLWTKAHGIALDTMTTGAACRTYNVLLAEGRQVAAALIAV